MESPPKPSKAAGSYNIGTQGSFSNTGSGVQNFGDVTNNNGPSSGNRYNSTGQPNISNVVHKSDGNGRGSTVKNGAWCSSGWVEIKSIALLESDSSIMASLLLLLALFTANLRITGGQIGVCYGTLGNDLPSAREVVDLYKANNIKLMRLYDPNQEALEALRDSGINLMLGVPNTDLHRLATNADDAREWVENSVSKFYPSVNIKYIAVGNEVNPVDGANRQYAPHVLPAIQNVYQAICARCLHEKIKVSTSIDMTLIGNSYPPSQGSFRDDVRSYFDPIIGYLVSAKAPLFANIYPYFAYCRSRPGDIPLNYALFTEPSVLVQDGSRGYQNLFDAMLDSLHAALDGTRIGPVKVGVSESGWPSVGEEHATELNAKTYLQNLIPHVNTVTPMRPEPVETYLFAVFDENKKVGQETERHFGLLYPNKQNKYPFGFGAQECP
ncbi:glucan endo-1,3-beta-glucosidase, basic isoform-like [Neltuma alba]|uniref:glucan endo-1,3-beta-glucosidase, basic isoform-like n=1 Tax=Neltuma alba TaxID=207710 RepID=UPI0010A36E1A|nr:glucan endo-1,3-beta-glucosidase, basic isoform-like [Prosopis alba]